MRDASEPADGLRVKPGMSGDDALARCVEAAPEAFADGRLHNLWGGEWRRTGVPRYALSPNDAKPIAGPPMIELPEARQAWMSPSAARRLSGSVAC